MFLPLDWSQNREATATMRLPFLGSHFWEVAAAVLFRLQRASLVVLTSVVHVLPAGLKTDVSAGSKSEILKRVSLTEGMRLKSTWRANWCRMQRKLPLDAPGSSLTVESLLRPQRHLEGAPAAAGTFYGATRWASCRDMWIMPWKKRWSTMSERGEALLSFPRKRSATGMDRSQLSALMVTAQSSVLRTDVWKQTLGVLEPTVAMGKSCVTFSVVETSMHRNYEALPHISVRDDMDCGIHSLGDKYFFSEPATGFGPWVEA